MTSTLHSDLQIVREALTAWHMQTPTMLRTNAQKARAALDSLEEQLEAAVELDERHIRERDQLDMFIRETIALWDAKGPLIASEELRERYANFTSNPASRQDAS